MAEIKYIYDITEENGALVATDQNGIIRKQLHNIADIYTYKANEALGTPENLKIVEKYGDSLELDALNTKSVAGTPISGSYSTLLAEINALIGSLNSFSVSTTLDPNAATLSEQEKQTLSLNEISTKNSVTNEYLRKKAGELTYYFDILTPSIGTFSFGDVFTFLQLSGAGGESATVPATTINTVTDFVSVWNDNMSTFKLEAKNANEVWILDGTKIVKDEIGVIFALVVFGGGATYQSDGFSLGLKGAETPTSNLDCILLAVDSIEQKTSFKNEPFQEETTNPSFKAYSGFKKLSFVADGAISVTVEGGLAIVYPQTIGGVIVNGSTFEADTESTKTVVFTGTGKIIVTIQK